MRVYDPEGNAHEKDPVDARECIQHCGYTLEPVEPVVNETGEGDEARADNTQKPAKK